jgi:internalin A
MSPLSHLTELRHLYLSGSPHTGFLPITNLSFLRPLKKLITLEITHSDLTDISALAELTELTYLKLFVCKITSVNGIQGLYNLKEAEMNSNKIKDLLPLYSRDVSLNSLEKLNLNDNEIEQLDLQVLNNMLHLEKISIYNNKVKNVPHDILHYGTIGEIRAYLRRNG